MQAPVKAALISFIGPEIVRTTTTTTAQPLRITGVDPTWADPVYSHPSGSLKGPVAVPFYRGSFLDRDPFIDLMIYSAGVEVDFLPSRIPPSNIHGVLVGVLSLSSYDVKHSFLPMGSKLDSRQFGLMGRREFPFTYLARSSQLVDRAAARSARCSRQPVQLGRTSPTGQFAPTCCPLLLAGLSAVLGVIVMYLLRPDDWRCPEHSAHLARSLVRRPPASLCCAQSYPSVLHTFMPRVCRKRTRTHIYQLRYLPVVFRTRPATSSSVLLVRWYIRTCSFSHDKHASV